MSRQDFMKSYGGSVVAFLCSVLVFAVSGTWAVSGVKSSMDQRATKHETRIESLEKADAAAERQDDRDAAQLNQALSEIKASLYRVEEKLSEKANRSELRR